MSERQYEAQGWINLKNMDDRKALGIILCWIVEDIEWALRHLGGLKTLQVRVIDDRLGFFGENK